MKLNVFVFLKPSPFCSSTSRRPDRTVAWHRMRSRNPKCHLFLMLIYYPLQQSIWHQFLYDATAFSPIVHSSTFIGWRFQVIESIENYWCLRELGHYRFMVYNIWGIYFFGVFQWHVNWKGGCGQKIGSFLSLSPIFNDTL